MQEGLSALSTAPGGYAALFRIPGLPRVFGWASLARLQFGVIPLVLLLLLAAQRESYAEAGAATAGYALTAGLLGPLRAHSADRWGHGRTLFCLATVNAVALGLVVLLAGAPFVLLMSVAVVAGCFPPPVGPVMRSTWRTLATGSQQLQTAYSLDTVTEELLFVVGPVVAAVGVAHLDGRAVLGLSAAALLTAALGLWRSLPSRDSNDCAPVEPVPKQPHWRSYVFLLGLTPALGSGILLGALDLAAIVAAIRLSGNAAAGLPAAVLSLGSVVGGLAYGRRRWPGRALRQAIACVGLTAAGAAIMAALVGHLLIFLLAVAFTGLFVAPAMIATYLAAEVATSEPTAETTSWVNSAFNVGAAVGTAFAGVLVDQRGPAIAILVGAIVASGVTATAFFVRDADGQPLSAGITAIAPRGY